MSTDRTDIPIVCTLDEDGLAERRRSDLPLLERLQASRELDDGYELTFPGDADTARAISDFIVSERECCRFFTIDVRYEPADGPIHLMLRGPEGTKQLLKQSDFFPSS